MKGTIDPQGRFVPLVAQPYIHIQESYIIHPLRHIYFSDGDARP
jgi:hypothetical protein